MVEIKWWESLYLLWWILGNLYWYYNSYCQRSGSQQHQLSQIHIFPHVASSGFGSGGSSDFTTLTNVPSGLVSGSSQLTSSYDTRYLNVNGDGVVSGSVLRTLDVNVVSGSVLRNLDAVLLVVKKLDELVKGKVLRTLDGTGVASGSSQITDGSGIVLALQITDGSGLVSHHHKYLPYYLMV